MTRHSNRIAVLLAIGAGPLIAGQVQAGSWQSNAPFGATLQGDLYTPTTPAAKPAIMVAIHYCSGNSGSAHGWFQSAADQYGFYIIAPNAGKNCFDSSLSRDSNSDPGAIVKMVQYVITNKNADPSRVFAAGYSSGGCMTNTLLAVFPDVFVGGSALPGFPAGLWPSGDTSCSKCGSSPGASDTGQKYADMATKVFSFSGTRPCSQQWAGGADEYNFDGWLPVVNSEFQILGSLSAGTSGTGAPNGWTRTVYKDSAGNVRLESNLGPSSQRHDLTGANLNGQVISFLGLDKPTGACGVTSTGAGGAGGGPGTGGTTGAGGSVGRDAGSSDRDGGGRDVASAGGGPGTGGSGSGGETSSSGSGGSSGSSGAPGNGGRTGSGGATGGDASTGRGGSAGNGGSVASGGSGSGGSGSGGAVASGGSGSGGSNSGGTMASGSGGASGTGGTSGGGSTTVKNSSSGGCSFSPDARPDGALAVLTLLGLALLGRSRRAVRREDLRRHSLWPR